MLNIVCNFALNRMTIPSPQEQFRRFIVTKVKDEVCAVQAVVSCSSSISCLVAQELQDASIEI